MKSKRTNNERVVDIILNFKTIIKILAFSQIIVN